MKRWLGSWVVAVAVVAVGGATPGCSCNHNGAANGDGGGGSAGSGGGSGGDGGVNACGDNDPGCTTVCLGPTCQPPSMFPLPGDMPPDPNVTADGVGRDGNGWIVLNQGSSNFNYLWIADDQSYWIGFVSKVDTRVNTGAGGGVNKTYREVARYMTVTCESNEQASWRDHTGYVSGSTTPTQLGTCDGTNGCCARTATGTTRTPVQLYHNRPSRTAVDFNGDAWVANRAHDAFGSADPADAGIHHQSSVTKIANKNNSITDTDCIDRNKNGKIDTSWDANGDGIINTDCNDDGLPDSLSNVTAANPCKGGLQQEFFGLDDECVLFTVNTGNEGGTGRPLALGQGSTDFAPSDAWAGRFTDGVFYRIDGTTGLVKATVNLGPIGGVGSRPYGAAIDSTGILWAPNIENANLFYFDTNNPTTSQGKASPPAPSPAVTTPGTFYGIAVDGYKAIPPGGTTPQLLQQVWLGRWAGDAPGAWRYTPNRAGGFASLGMGTWTLFAFSGVAGGGSGRGIGVDNRQPQSFAWVGIDGGASIGRMKIDDSENASTTSTNVVTIAAASGTTLMQTTQSGTLGSGVAADLDVWGINNGSSTATHFQIDTNGNLANPTPDQVKLDDNGVTPGATTTHHAPFPYTYSDFTGFGLRNFTNPHGSYSYIWTGCGVGKTRWIGVTWDAATPPGTSISMKARSSDDKSTFSTATYTGNFTSSPADLLNASPSGGGALAPNPSGFLQVEFDLTTTDKNATPALKSYTVIYECVNGIG